ncbi:MAG: spermidine synthase [Proteobacteria bacterium]|nr:spermidine synthase [Pseudomonadota bacterium]
MTDEVLERVALPDGKEMQLTRWEFEGAEYVSIKVDRRILMSSHEHGSEDALGELIAERLADLPAPRLLIGGLGLGYTLRAALDGLPAAATIVVAELVPALVAWNRGAYGDLAGRPLDDPRVELVVDDVANVIPRGGFDGIVLDVDNGPDALTYEANARLYKRAGLARARAALNPGGLLAVWSAFPSKTFSKWMETVGEVELKRAPPTTPGGPRYYIWLAQRS